MLEAEKSLAYARGLPVYIVRDLQPGAVYVGSMGRRLDVAWFAGSREAMDKVLAELERRVFRAKAHARLAKPIRRYVFAVEMAVHHDAEDP